MSDSKNVILGVTGSIAAVKSASIAMRLRDAGFTVRVAMTHSARQIVTPQVLRAVSDSPPFYDMWWPDDEEGNERHVSLARWAHAIVIAPATSSCIASLSHGLYDNCVTLVAANIPSARWIVAPAMAQEMWDQKAVSENVRRIVEWGATLIGPVAGQVASGVPGQRMAEPDEIARAVEGWWRRDRR